MHVLGVPDETSLSNQSGRLSQDVWAVSIRSSFWQAVAAAATGVLPLDEVFCGPCLRQGPVQFLGLFLATGRSLLFETPDFGPFWFLFLGRELYQVTAFYHLLDDLAAQVGPEKNACFG